MTADRRAVTTDALATLGTIIQEEGTRDAIHLAVLAVTAGERLAPGAEIGFRDVYGVAYETGAGLGIVDPFIKRHVQEGEKFWMVVKPRTITSLRHVWEHPSFDTKAPATEAEEELKKMCAELGCRPDEIMSHAKWYLEDGDYWSEGGRWEGYSTPDNFWDVYEKISGEKVPEDKRHSFFSCSC